MSDAGKRLIQIHGRYLSIDNNGNLLLDTANQLAGAVKLGNTPHFGGFMVPSEVGITNGVGSAANICNVSFQAQDLAGNPVTDVVSFDVMLSDAATGAGLTAATASGGIAAVAGNGAIIGVLTAAKGLRVQTNANGLFVLAITDVAKSLFFPVAALGYATFVGAQLTAGSYHP